MGSDVAAASKFILTRRQKLLLPMVMLGAFFEGFDFSVVNMALPFISRDLKLDASGSGFVISTIAIGALLAFFVVRLADKLGRRPVFLWSVVIYSLLSLATAFVHNVELFVTCQLLARVFLITCWAVGYVIMSEEFAPELRGRAIALFQSAAAIGGIFPAVFMPIFAKTALDWRGLYILGALPMVLIIFGMKNFPETESFQRIKAGLEVKTIKPGVFSVFKAPFRRHIFAIMGLWFFMYCAYASAMNFFSLHVVNELGWTSAQVGPLLAVASLCGLLGFAAVGKTMDKIGRKRAAAIFFVCGVAGIIGAFQATQVLYIWILQIVGTFFAGTFTVLCASFTNELFPTEIRANAMAWGNNIVGRIGTVIAPAAVGMLVVPMKGITNAVSFMALGGILCILIIALFLPEPLGYKIPEFEVASKEVA